MPRSARTVTALVATLAVATLAGALGPAATPAHAAPSILPVHTLPLVTSQVILVHTATAGSSYATLDTYQRRGGVWRRQFAPMPARLGALGFSDHHVEGTPNTPTGRYEIGATMYGIDPDPGVRYAFHRLAPGDYWNEASGTHGYNRFVHGADPGGPSEALWRISPAYRYFAVIDYNMPAVAGRGSAIFLHESTGGPTAGCVSLSHTDLARVLTWLNPPALPRIVLTPDQDISRY